MNDLGAADQSLKRSAGPSAIRFGLQDVEFGSRPASGDHHVELGWAAGIPSDSVMRCGYVHLLAGTLPTKILDYEESLLLLSGQFRVVIDGENLELRPGEALWIAKGSRVTYSGVEATLFFAVSR